MSAFSVLCDNKDISSSKFELIKILTHIMESEIIKGKGIDTKQEVKNRSFQILQRLLDENPDIKIASESMEQIPEIILEVLNDVNQPDSVTT